MTTENEFSHLTSKPRPSLGRPSNGRLVAAVGVAVALVLGGAAIGARASAGNPDRHPAPAPSAREVTPRPFAPEVERERPPLEPAGCTVSGERRPAFGTATPKANEQIELGDRPYRLFVPDDWESLDVSLGLETVAGFGSPADDAAVLVTVVPGAGSDVAAEVVSGIGAELAAEFGDLSVDEVEPTVFLGTTGCRVVGEGDDISMELSWAAVDGDLVLALALTRPRVTERSESEAAALVASLRPADVTA